MVKVLGIDQSTKLGWGIGSPDMTRPKFGLLHLPTDRGDGFMLCVLRNWLTKTIHEYEITDIFIEESIIPKNQYNVRSRIVLLMIRGIIELTAYDKKIPTYEVSIDKWHKRFIGTTSAPRRQHRLEDKSRDWWKSRAIAECARRDWFVDDDNIAEGLAIMDYGLCCLDRGYAARTDPLMRRAELESSRRQK